MDASASLYKGYESTATYTSTLFATGSSGTIVTTPADKYAIVVVEVQSSQSGATVANINDTLTVGSSAKVIAYQTVNSFTVSHIVTFAVPPSTSLTWSLFCSAVISAHSVKADIYYFNDRNY